MRTLATPDLLSTCDSLVYICGGLSGKQFCLLNCFRAVTCVNYVHYE